MSYVQIEPYTDAHCEQLVSMSLASAGESSEDAWRQREWPFCARHAALLQAASLQMQWLPDGKPCAYAIFVTSPGSVEPTLAGLIAISGVDETEQSGIVGTYITPTLRKRGIQRDAKYLLFAMVAHSLRHVYCVIEADNAPSLRAIRHVDGAQEMRDAATWPRTVRDEIWRMQKPVAVFHFDMAPWVGYVRDTRRQH